VPKYTTPGVYVQELPTIPPGVVDVASAVPAFVGYTARATRLSPGDLAMRPTRIASFVEFEALFGGAQAARVSEVQVDAQGNFLSATCDLDYPLFQSLRLYFANGGGPCYVVSAGSYSGTPLAMDGKALVAGVEALATLEEPTLLVCPDAALLGELPMALVQQAMLQQCRRLQDRFAVLDTRLDDPHGQSFRSQIGLDALSYGAAYTPWLKTLALCSAGYAAWRGQLRQVGKPVVLRDFTADPAVLAQLAAIDQALDTNPAADVAKLELWLEVNFAAYRSILVGVRDKSTVACPSSGAVTGAYVAMDTQRGVWKSPANVSLSGVTATTVAFNGSELDALNMDTQAGKSINAIRVFTGKGVLIWGARTLAGNDNEWRYVSVRRLFILVEESIKKSTAWVVFESNDANTWNALRGMIENYLTQKWRDGALQGIKPEQAFFVRCGVGQTMTAKDVLEGRLNIEIGMAVVRPAEFSILRFSHHMHSL
jgi:phage tail sheath protein FI